MSFTPAGAVTALTDLLATVESVGLVHAYRRTARTLNDMHALLFDSTVGKLRGAYVTVSRMVVGGREFGSPTSAGVLTTVTLQVELFRGIEDAEASEVTFRDTVFDVLQAVNRRGKIYSASSHQDPMSAPQIGYIVLADAALLHYALCQVEIRGRTAP